MQITFDPHNKEEANEVLAMIQQDTWPVEVTVDGKSVETTKPKAEAKKSPAKKEPKKEEPESGAKPVTKADLVAELKPLMTDKSKRDAVKDLFTEFGADTLGGVKETDYAELLEKVKGLG